MKKKELFIILTLLISILFSINAQAAYQTRVNVTIWEIVHKNTTFAENFELTESVKMFTMVGYINISNPSDDNTAINDIYVRLTNLSNVISNITNISGRNSKQIVFPKYINTTFEYDQVTNVSWFEIGKDIDEDGTGDMMKINATHLLVNCTSERIPFIIQLANQTNNVNLASTATTQYCLNFTSTLTSYKDAMNEYGNLSVVGCTGNDGNASQMVINSTVTFEITDEWRPYTIIHVPELRAGQDTILNYTLNITTVLQPLNVTTNYTHSQRTKVLAGEFFNVTDTIKNEAQIEYPITDINITLETLPVLWNSTSDWFYFSYLWDSDLCGTSAIECDSINNSDYSNVSNLTNTTWNWKVAGGSLAYGNEVNISYQVKAPRDVPSTGTYNAVRMTLRYRLNKSISNITVAGVNASSQIFFNFTKRISVPQDNLNNHNVTWEIKPVIFTNLIVNYTVYQTTLWITDSLNPGNKSVGDNFEKSYSTSPLTTINESVSWAGEIWAFNYTDGYNGSFPPPIVWMKPTFFITNDNTQIWNYTYTLNGTDVYIKYIYIIFGYWLEVYKNITNIGEGVYNVSVIVHNRGNGWTPNSSIVTVYDFVPSNFQKGTTRFNSTPRFAESETVQNVTGALYTGQAIKWDIGFIPGERTACFSPKVSTIPTEGANDSWFAYYTVTGSGDYVVSDLYIVGLDPRQVDGAYASPFISVLSGISSYSMEIIFVIIVVVLLVLNISNFVMTRRIHKKLAEDKNIDSIKEEINNIKKKIKE